MSDDDGRTLTTAQRVTRARQDAGLSKMALAERIGVRLFVIDRYEAGSPIPPHHLEAIAEATARPAVVQSAEVSSVGLKEIRQAFAQEASRLLAAKEQTLSIAGEGDFDLPKPLQGYKRDIERQLVRFPFGRNVFVMMKFRASNKEVAEYVAENLAKRGFNGVRADDVAWTITGNLYNPIAVLYCCKYGIALFDEPEEGQAYSPNVAYELGMMHQQNKVCLILKHATLPTVPFDLIKDLYVVYEKDLVLRQKIDRWLDEVAQRDADERAG